MKKILPVFIIVILLLLTSCAQNKNPLFDIEEDYYHSSTDLNITTEKENYSSNDTVIHYTITNVSDQENAIAGDSHCFTLQKLVDGKWQRVGTKEEHAWNSIALILPPNESSTRQIELEKYFHLPLEKGTYRIAVEHLLSNTFEIS
ncbi:MAG: membrane lipoprotein lipid attachment site-containing protein [Clostridia bacterium]|nr:membrane lipoprotein lipid attachment site-containing protein [Clostridia bacterium]